MKKIITTLLLCACLLPVLAQDRFIYQDAVVLAGIYSPLSEDAIIKVHNTLYKEYGITAAEANTNPFLKYLYNDFNTIENSGLSNGLMNITRTETDTKRDDAKNVLYTVSDADGEGANITTGGNLEAVAINAIATFMAERFKQEVMQMGIDNLFKYITGPQKATFERLFPKTYQQINILYETHEYYAVDFVFLKQLVALDISEMGKNIATLFASRKEILGIFPEVDEKTADVMCIAGNVFKNILENQSVNTLIENTCNQPYVNDDIKEFAAFIGTLNKALQKSDNTYITIGTDIRVNGNISNGSTESFFLGLLYHKIVSNPKIKKAAAYLKDVANAGNVKPALVEILNIAPQLNNARNTLAGINYNINNTQDLIKVSNELMATFSVLANFNVVKETFKINTTGIEKVVNYARVITEFYKKGKDDYKGAIVLLIAEVAKNIKDPKVTRTILFVTQLLSVEKPDDMEALLKTYALPIGSSSIKRNSPFNISLNGYVGGNYGWQYNSPAKFTKASRSKQFGITAPIGLTLSFAPHKCGSLSIFASVIDIGSVVNQRIKNDTTYYTKLRFDQFLAFGGGIFYNIKRTPITLGATCIYYPNLTYFAYDSSTGDATPTKSVEALRINLSLLVDIPFFTIYNKSNMLKKKQ